MSATAADVLDRVEREGIPPLHVRRLQHAAAVVREALRRSDPSWLTFAEQIVKAGRSEDWARVHELIMEGYRRVLFERAEGDVEIPQTEEEWEKLPDAIDELERRRQAG